MKIIKIGSIALIAAVIAAITFSMDSFAKKRIKQSAQKAINAGSKDVVAPTAPVVKIAPEVPSDEVVVDQKEVLQRATAKTQLIEDKAMDEMDKARQKLIEGEINLAQALKIIGEQNTTIAQAKQELKRTIAKSVEAVEASDAQQGSLDYFMSGIKTIGQKALAPFQAGYGYTQEEKELAEQVIKGLIKQKEQITADYDRAKEKALDITKRSELRERYDAIISELNNEIYQQQLITGEVMSTERKLFWAAVVAGGAVAGLAALSSGMEAKQAQLNVQLEQQRGLEAIEAAKLEEQRVAGQAEDLEMAKIREQADVRPLWNMYWDIAEQKAQLKDDKLAGQKEDLEMAKIREMEDERVAVETSLTEALDRAVEKSIAEKKEAEEVAQAGQLEEQRVAGQAEDLEMAKIREMEDERVATEAALTEALDRAVEKSIAEKKEAEEVAQAAQLEEQRVAGQEEDLEMADIRDVELNSALGEASRVEEEAKAAAEAARLQAEAAEEAARMAQLEEERLQGQKEDLEMADIREGELTSALYSAAKAQSREWLQMKKDKLAGQEEDLEMAKIREMEAAKPEEERLAQEAVDKLIEQARATEARLAQEKADGLTEGAQLKAEADAVEAARLAAGDITENEPFVQPDAGSLEPDDESEFSEPVGI